MKTWQVVQAGAFKAITCWAKPLAAHGRHSALRLRRSLLIAAAVWSCQSLPAAAIWDYEFTGVEMLAAPWMVTQPGRMETDPPATWLQINGNLGDAYVENSTDWAPGSNATIEFDFTLVTPGLAYAQSVYIFTGSYHWNIKINHNVVNIQGDIENPGTSVLVDVGYTENVYRLVITGGTASLYFNNNPTPLIADQAGGTTFDFTNLWVGDWGGIVNGDGRWNSLRWNNTEAIAPIPEPGTAVLAAGGLIVFGLFRRRVMGARRRK